MAEYTSIEESLNRFLITITAELEAHKRFMGLYASKLAPGFNAVDCLGPDENRLSRVIAMLLDPKGGHGQGAVFLDLFLKTITQNSKYIKNPSQPNPLEELINICTMEIGTKKTQSLLEVPTIHLEKGNENRRIDILIDIDGFGLAIENKPWAIDQPRQIIDYHTQLSRQYRERFILIYLSRNGDPPSSNSVIEVERLPMENTGHLIVMSYLQLKEWCQRCEEKCFSPRVRFFLGEFIEYIELRFGGGANMVEHELVIGRILNNRKDSEYLNLAFLVAQSIEPIKTKLMFELNSSLQERSDKLTGGIVFKPDTDLFCKYNGFTWTKPEWNKLIIRFAFESANASELLFGVASDSKDDSMAEIERLKLLFKEKLGSDGTFDPPYWYWWKNWGFPGWGNNNELWIEIYNETLPYKIMEEVDRIANALDNLQSGYNLAL